MAKRTIKVPNEAHFTVEDGSDWVVLTNVTAKIEVHLSPREAIRMGKALIEMAGETIKRRKR